MIFRVEQNPASTDQILGYPNAPNVLNVKTCIDSKLRISPIAPLALLKLKISACDPRYYVYIINNYISLPADQYPKLVHMLVDHALTGCCTTWLFRDGCINMCTDLVWYWLLLPNKQSEQTTVTL